MGGGGGGGVMATMVGSLDSVAVWSLPIVLEVVGSSPALAK